MPPFEDLPIFLQVILTLSSVLILLVGGNLICRMARTMFKRDKEGPG